MTGEDIKIYKILRLRMNISAMPECVQLFINKNNMQSAEHPSNNCITSK